MVTAPIGEVAGAQSLPVETRGHARAFTVVIGTKARSRPGVAPAIARAASEASTPMRGLRPRSSREEAGGEREVDRDVPADAEREQDGGGRSGATRRRRR